MWAPSWGRPLPFFRGEPIPDTFFLTDTFKPVQGRRPISTGAYAVVQISQSVADPSNVVAIKMLRYSEDEEGNAEMDRILLKEITPLLLAYKHRNILEFKGLVQNPLGIVTVFVENGSLAYYLQKNPYADRPKIRGPNGDAAAAGIEIASGAPPPPLTESRIWLGAVMIRRRPRLLDRFSVT